MFAPAASMNKKGALSAMKKNLQMKTEQVTRRPTVLRFSPTAWTKLLFLRDAGDTEIGAFGISAPDDLLLVEDVQLVAQTCTWVHVGFDDEAVANFFDGQVDAGRRPESFGRLWLHTHPGSSPEPSGTDEATFTRVFGRSDWAVMFILARGGQTYARLRYNVGPGAEFKLPVEVDFSRPFNSTNFEAWQEEYLANVRLPPTEPPKKTAFQQGVIGRSYDDPFLDDWRREAWDDYLEFESTQQETEHGFISDF
jgi:proteasome lid subunit RPN8/RPN11